MTKLVWATREHVPGLLRLLHEKMNAKFSAERWQRLFDYDWLDPKPDYGVAAVVETADGISAPGMTDGGVNPVAGSTPVAAKTSDAGISAEPGGERVAKNVPPATGGVATGAAEGDNSVNGKQVEPLPDGLERLASADDTATNFSASEQVVGAHVHVYADRVIPDADGRERVARFANLSSWYVDKAHRGGGTGSTMVRMAASIPGVVCTVFSLSRLRVDFYRGLGLDVLDDSRLVWVRSDGWRIVPLSEAECVFGAEFVTDEKSVAGAESDTDSESLINANSRADADPTLSPDVTGGHCQTEGFSGSCASYDLGQGGVRVQKLDCPREKSADKHFSVERDPERIARRVSGAEARVLTDMAPYAVTPVLVSAGDEDCLLYLSIKEKGDDVLFYDVLRCTNLPFLARHAQHIADQLLPDGRPAVLAADSRFVPGGCRGAVRLPLESPRFYTPGIVPPQQVDMLYCELQLLDLKLA